MMKNNFSWWALCMLLLQLPAGLFAQSYKISSSNLVSNSQLNSNADKWTLTNSSYSGKGWFWEDVLLYGKYIFIDRPGTSTASPTLSAPCPNAPKVVRFKYQSANTGKFTFNVKLGGQAIATFVDDGIWARCKMTVPAGIGVTSVNRTFIKEGNLTASGGTYTLGNNIWHIVELYVPAYASGGTTGNLVFEENGATGMSRQIRIDDAALFEAIPTPVPQQTTVTLADCDITTTDLTKLNPTDGAYTYTWYADVTGTTAVSDATKAPIGTYYLFASKTNCSNNTAKSLPSAAVTVNGAPGCCNTNVIQDGGFDQTDASDSPKNFFVPKGDNSTGGGLYWKRNVTNADNYFNIADYSDGTTTLKGAVNSIKNGGKAKAIFQPNNKICLTGTKVITFDFVTGSRNADGAFSIFLTPPSGVDFTISGVFTEPPAVRILKFFSDTNTICKVESIAQDVTATVGGVNVTKNSTFTSNKVVRVVITVPENLANAYGGLAFYGDSTFNWYIDNVSVTVAPPAAQSPTVASGSIACGSTTFDLSAATPTKSGYAYEWYSDAAGTNRVTDITKVPAGNYYLKTISTCSGCSSINPTAFTVSRANCASISGKVYVDYDGTANGVSGGSADGDGQSAGLFAHLVNSSDNVVTSVPVNSDGTYSMTATPASGNFRVFINNSQLANNTTAPNGATLNPNYAITSASKVGSTDYAPIATGYSPTFTLGSAASPSTVTGVNFGVTFQPIAADAGGTVCNPGAGVAYTVPALYGISDYPNFNNGVGQKVIIKAASTSNGTLSYNGNNITAASLPYTIASYDPSLLKFTPATAAGASFTFNYTFTTPAGIESGTPGVISYSFVETPSITGQGKSVNTSATLELTGSGNPAVPVAWTSSNNSVATVNNSGLVTGVAIGTAYITYTNDGGCTTTYEVTVTTNGVCYRAASVTGAPGKPTKVGITTMQRAADGASNWPGVRNSGWLVLESKTKPFVITRMTSSEINALTAQPGMLVYDTTDNCLKMYNGTWKCVSTPSCP